MAKKCHLSAMLAFVAHFMNMLQVGQGVSEDHQRLKRDEDYFNYTGLWISNGVMVAFVSLIVMYGLYKSYIGEIEMPVRRTKPSKENDNAPRVDEVESYAVNPAFVDDQNQSSAATQTDFPEENKMHNMVKSI